MSAVVIHTDVIQNSPEWHQLRCGIPTASNFSKILAKGKGYTRSHYLYAIAAERMSGIPGDGYYTNHHFDRGHEVEPEARQLYEFVSENDVQQVGFVTNEIAGCSPDGIVGDDGLIEIKSGLAHIVAKALAEGKVPSEHTAQVQGALWVTERAWLDFVLYCPNLPIFIKRVERDAKYIDELEREVKAFVRDVDDVVARINARGKSRSELRSDLQQSILAAG